MDTKPSIIQGIYAITDPHLLPDDRFIEKITAACLGGVRAVQYRNKINDIELKHKQAKTLVEICRHHNVLSIINDTVALAQAVDADGVHLGQQDLQTENSIQHVRQKLGANKLIGITCHNNLTWAKFAEQCGADYVSFGRFFRSQTKPQASTADLDILSQAKNHCHCTVVAIGGITLENSQQLFAAGADSLAICHALFAAENITETTKKFNRIMYL